MSLEVIPVKEITRFESREEEFFPIEWYRKMLYEHPVYFDEKTESWNLFKYNHVKEVMGNYEYFSSEGPRTTIFVGANNDDQPASPSGLSKLTMLDPPDHRKARSLLSAAFTPRSLKEWEPRIRQIAKQLVEAIEPGETVNVVDALTSPFPGMVIADLFGVPVKDQRQFKQWVDILFQPYDKEKLEVIEKQKETAAKEYFAYLYPVVVRKRAEPEDDIISDLIRAEVDGETLTNEEIVQATMLLLGAGVETTSHGIANMFYSLLYDDRSLYRELRENPHLSEKAVEEMLRYRFHMSRRDRTVTKDNDLLGFPLRKGDVVITWLSASNMDEEIFEDPFTLNIHRENNRKHLTFGNGPHFCLGAPLARLEMKIILEAFLQRFSGIAPEKGFRLEENLTDSATGQTLTNLPMKACL